MDLFCPLFIGTMLNSNGPLMMIFVDSNSQFRFRFFIQFLPLQSMDDKTKAEPKIVVDKFYQWYRWSSRFLVKRIVLMYKVPRESHDDIKYKDKHIQDIIQTMAAWFMNCARWLRH